MERRISVKASPTTWTVDDDGAADFNTIQEAVNQATSGDRIFVRIGIYYEHVIINKSVSLIGENTDSTIVDGNETGSVISITANSVSIEGFTIKRSGLLANEYDSGIFVDHSSGNNISHNTITDNYYGISLYSSANNLVSENTITDNYYGISLYSSVNNLVSENTITNNEYGISLYSSVNNIVSENTITDNDYGIIVFDSSTNVIFHNNFVNNDPQAYSYNSINVWDNGKEGNYWSDYTGVDLYGGPYQNETGSDGIGDSAYIITPPGTPIGSIQFDYYPLMGMFYHLTVTLKRETYHVTVICNSTISEFRFEVGAETGNKIIRFNVTGKDDTAGFCRVGIPTDLMDYPQIVLVSGEEIVPTLLGISNETHLYLYFTYVQNSHIIAIISSKTLHIYNQLLDKNVKLQMDLQDLNAKHYDLLSKYNILLGNYSQFQESYNELNNSYQEHLSDYSRNVHNVRSLMYIFAASTVIFIISTIYLSKNAHASKSKALK